MKKLIIICMMFICHLSFGQVTIKSGELSNIFIDPQGLAIKVNCQTILGGRAKLKVKLKYVLRSVVLIDAITTGIYECTNNQGILRFPDINRIAYPSIPNDIILPNDQTSSIIFIQALDCNSLTYVYNINNLLYTEGAINNSCFSPENCSIGISNTSINQDCQINGSITLNITGGISPYIYKWADLTTNGSNVRNNLNAGIYNVTVTDRSNCKTMAQIEIKNNCNPLTVNCSDFLTSCGDALVSLANEVLSQNTSCDQWSSNGQCDLAYRLGGVSIGAHNLNTHKLSVTEGIISKSLRVKTDILFPDYVFDDKYNLMSLENVDSFIAQNKHLPRTPSAKEIEKAGGFEVGSVVVNHQEKIEEIYLHLIKLKKDVDMIDKNIDTLTNENTNLKIAFINLILDNNVIKK